MPKLLRRETSSLHGEVALPTTGELDALERREALRVEPSVVLQVVMRNGRNVFTKECPAEACAPGCFADIARQ